LINAIYFLPLLLLNQNRKNVDDFSLRLNFSSVRILFNIVTTFCLSTLAWIFFRSKTIHEAIAYIQRMFSNFNFKEEYLAIERYNHNLITLLLIFIVVEWFSRTKVEPISGKYSWLKMSLCLAAILALGVFSDYKEFIYFQF